MPRALAELRAYGMIHEVRLSPLPQRLLVSTRHASGAAHDVYMKLRCRDDYCHDVPSRLYY